MSIVIWILLAIVIIVLVISGSYLSAVALFVFSPLLYYLSDYVDNSGSASFIGGTSSKDNPLIDRVTVKNDKPYEDRAYIKYSDLDVREKYNHGFVPEYPGNHFGQRKLVLSEIMFLALKAEPDKKYYVIYAGSAPSIKFPVLYELFPNCTFILVDPNNFGKWTETLEHEKLSPDDDPYSRIINSQKRAFIINDIMTIEISDNLQKLDNILFISDIRTNMVADAPTEFDILFNNLQQKLWLDILKPVSYMLKFRCIYVGLDQDKYYDDFMESVKNIPEWKIVGDKYVKDRTPLSVRLDGEIYLQCWPGGKSTEMRIIGNSREIVDIDDVEFEEKMYYYNMYLRNHPESHKLKFADLIDTTKESYRLSPDKASIYCGCNDCRIEVYWIKEYVDRYIEKYGHNFEKVVELLNKYAQSIVGHSTKNLTVEHKFGINNSKKKYMKIQ